MQFGDVAVVSPLKHQEDPPKTEECPATRPIILVGPSLKGYDVTDMLQKAVFDNLQKRFGQRMIIKKVTADISSAERTAQVQAEMDQIEELTHSNKIVFLDSEAINYPSQLENSPLNPIFVYIKSNSLKVVERLIRSRGEAQIQFLEAQMEAAEKLLQSPNNAFDFVLDENELENVCEHFSNYLLSTFPMF